MTTDDDKLAAFFRSEAPAATDAAFRIGVLEQVERRAFRRKLGVLTGAGAITVAVCWTFAPQLEAAAAGSANVLAGLGAAAALVFASLVLTRTGVRA